MANKDPKNVKRFVEDVSKEVAKAAYNGGGDSSYTAGNGIDITDNTISVDTTVIQEKLTAGEGISISEENVISASGGGTTVIANPELSGDEADLTGLQVGETKYKVPEGGGIEYVDLETTTGTLTNETILKARNGEILFRYNNNVFLHSNFMASVGDVYSTVMDENSHYLKMVINTRSYQYEIETVSGGSAQHYHKVVLLTEISPESQYCFSEIIVLDVYIDTPESLTVADIWDYIRTNGPVFIQADSFFGTMYYDQCDATDPLFDYGGIDVSDFTGAYAPPQQLLSTYVTIAYDQYI